MGPRIDFRPPDQAVKPLKEHDRKAAGYENGFPGNAEYEFEDGGHPVVKDAVDFPQYCERSMAGNINCAYNRHNCGESANIHDKRSWKIKWPERMA